jgi:hypothetical protein
LILALLEVFEFDAMDDPPSRMDIAIYDSSGSCNEVPIGHTEVNFLKNILSDLTDIWLTLDGKCDRASKPKLHLRIFLNNSRGTEVVMNYLAKMGKEVGKKVRNWAVLFFLFLSPHHHTLFVIVIKNILYR